MFKLIYLLAHHFLSKLRKQFFEKKTYNKFANFKLNILLQLFTQFLLI